MKNVAIGQPARIVVLLGVLIFPDQIAFPVIFLHQSAAATAQGRPFPAGEPRECFAAKGLVIFRIESDEQIPVWQQLDKVSR